MPGLREGKREFEQYIAKLKIGSDSFEVVINPEKALDVRSGKAAVADALLVPKIFSNARKGELAPESKLKQLFGTTDVSAIAEKIIKQGEIQLPAEYRAKLLEAKKRQLVELIKKLGVDPRTGQSHTPARIEAGLEQAKFKIDAFKPAEAQVKEALAALRPILPISLMKKRIQIGLPAQFAGKCYGIVKQFGQIVSEDWTGGGWNAVVEIPGGLEQELYEKLNAIAKGQVQSKLLALLD